MAGQKQEQVITKLAAYVRVELRTGDKQDKPVMQQHGFDEQGKPNLVRATKLVNLHRGDPLPDNLAAGELDRLTADGAVGTKADIDAIYRRARGLRPAPENAPAAEPPAPQPAPEGEAEPQP